MLPWHSRIYHQKRNLEGKKTYARLTCLQEWKHARLLAPFPCSSDNRNSVFSWISSWGVAGWSDCHKIRCISAPLSQYHHSNPVLPRIQAPHINSSLSQHTDFSPASRVCLRCCCVHVISRISDFQSVLVGKDFTEYRAPNHFCHVWNMMIRNFRFPGWLQLSVRDQEIAWKYIFVR